MFPGCGVEFDWKQKNASLKVNGSGIAPFHLRGVTVRPQGRSSPSIDKQGYIYIVCVCQKGEIYLVRSDKHLVVFF